MPLIVLALLSSPALSATLSGSVHSAEDGSPLAQVAVQAFDQQLKGVQVTTDAEGRFVFEDLPPGSYRVRAVPDWDVNRLTRWAPGVRDFCESPLLVLEDEADGVAGIEIGLEPGSTLSGRLLDSAGEPASYIVVYAGGADEASQSLVARPGISDADGHFSITGLDTPESGSASWLVLATADSYPDQYLGPSYEPAEASTFSLSRQASLDIGSHTLLDGILVSGTVEGPSGPVAGADVRVYAGGQIQTVQSDESGRYTAIGLPPGDVLPWVDADGLALTYYPDQDRPTGFLSAPDEGFVLEGADLFPPPEAIARLRFVDPRTGEPVPEVQGLLYNDTQTVGRGDVAGADGILTVDGLHGGQYLLYAWAASQGFSNDYIRGEDGQPLLIEIEAEVENPVLDLPLVPAAVLSGTITDGDGAPVYGATVVARRLDAPEGEASPSAAVLSALDGSFSIPGLPAGEWTVEAEYVGWCPGDPTYVKSYWPGEVNPDWAGAFDLAEGERYEGIDLVMPADLDQDGMGDAWEERWGLEPWRNDANEDPDGDEYSNLTEYLLDTNPVESTEEGCSGCGGKAAVLLLLPVLGLARRRRG